jgi:hypothetical protein
MAVWVEDLVATVVVPVAGKHNKKAKNPLYEMDARTI